MDRVVVGWNLGAGGLGSSVFYFGAGEGAAGTADLGTFFNAIKAQMPPAVSVDIPSSGDSLLPADGSVVGSWAGGTSAHIVGTGSTPSYAAGTGAYIRWVTSGLVAGRHVYGRTFICPLYSGAYDNDGTLAAGVVTALQTAATNFVASSTTAPRVYSRPTSTRVGTDHVILSAVAPDRVTSLASRRR